MLIFGKSVGDWKEKAAYAQEKGQNEYAKLHEVRCEGIEDVMEAFMAMAAFASDTNCKKFLYHATINLNPGERLTREQWQLAVDTLERNLKLEGHHRVVFEHIKNGRQHYHIVWARMPPDGCAAVSMSNDYSVHQSTAKALELKFGLRPAPRRNKGKPSYKKQAHDDRNSKFRVDPNIVSKDVTKAFRESGTAQEFIKNLTKSGYVLCRGKKDSLVLVDKQGGYHGLMRRIEGAKIADLRCKFPTLEKMSFPPLNDVLKSRRPAPVRSHFKKSARSFARAKARGNTPRLFSCFRPVSYKPASASIKALTANLHRRYKADKDKKYYPPPIMRKRRSKKDKNEPSRPVFNLKEIEDAEALAWAWEHKQIAVLRSFGIILPDDYFEP